MHLRWDKDVGDVLVLTEKGKVEDDFDGLRISGHDDELSNTTVKGLGGWGRGETGERSLMDRGKGKD